MIFGVIQVRCQRPERCPAQAVDHALEVAVEGDAVLALPHLPAQALGEMRLVKEQHRTLRRRPPFHRRDMRERIKAAPIGGKNCFGA